MKQVKQAVALRHVAFEDLGSLEPLLESRGYQVRYAEATGFDDGTAAEVQQADLVVILGGPMSVNDTEDYPWLIAELDAIKKRLRAHKPTLGLCLGAQLMAKSLGARVYAAPEREIGWGRLEINPEGERLGLSPFADGHAQEAGSSPILHWHGETFDLPSGAVLLASNEVCVNQAFALGSYGLAFQFHPEVEYPGLEAWFAGHNHELNSEPRIDIPGLRAASKKNSPGLAEATGAMFNTWLDSTGL